MPDKGHILSGWKEIATYLGRGVRTVQRWETMHRLPVHRPAETDKAAVVAFAGELDNWIRQSSLQGHPYVRPTIIILDIPSEETLSNRKLAAEIAKFNVLTAFTSAEMLATADRFDADVFVIDLTIVDAGLPEICQQLKARFPRKPIIAIGTDPQEACKADRFVEVGHPNRLVSTLIELVGEPQVVPTHDVTPEPALR